LLFGLVILLTLSRSSWIAAGIGGGIVILATARPRRIAFAAAGLGALYLLLLAFSQLSVFDSTLSPLAMLARRLSALDLAMDPRWLYHGVLYQLFAGSPVWGIGLGNFALAAAGQLRMETLASAHSVWLAHLVEGGIIGLGALLVLIGALGRRVISGWRAGRACAWRIPLIGVTAGLTAMSVQYLTFGDRFDPHFWFFAALALRISVEASKGRQSPT
jgi:O-antigen ligase